MSLSTLDGLVAGLGLRCPSSSYFLRREWLSYAFRQITEAKLWSWQRKRGQFIMPLVVNAGTVSVTTGAFDVQGTGTAWTTDLVNRQFRVAVNTPIYTIAAVDDVNQVLTLTDPWGAISSTNVGYSIYKAYVTAPFDFQNFITVWDPQFNWQLQLNVTQEELNIWDSQRANRGNAYVVASYGYDRIASPPLPMYEIWPHVLQPYVFPFLYISRPPDLTDDGADLPRYIRGDMLLEMALANCARWPGPSSDSPNPYFNLQLAMQHEARASAMLIDVMRTDDEIIENQVSYQSLSAMPFASIPWGDARFLQAHDF